MPVTMPQGVFYTQKEVEELLPRREEGAQEVLERRVQALEESDAASKGALHRMEEALQKIQELLQARTHQAIADDAPSKVPREEPEK